MADSASGKSVKSGKITEYEAFVNERLRGDLKRVLEARDSIYNDLAEYHQLSIIIERIRGGPGGSGGGVTQRDLKTMVDLGANFYAQARVPDASHICVAVGFGFYVEFTLDEALRFIECKVAHLTERGRQLSKQASEISARIKLVLEALHELQFSTHPTEDPPRAIW